MRPINNLTSFIGSVVSASVSGPEVLVKLERPTGESKTTTDLVVLAWNDEAEATVCIEQLKSFCIGETVLLLGDHLGTRGDPENRATAIDLEELRIIGTTFGEAVRKAAEKIPLAIVLGPVKNWKDFEKWFRDISKGLWDKKYHSVNADGAVNPIARGTGISSVSVPMQLPVGKTTLVGVTQSADELNEWGEKAAKGKRITWFGFKVEPTPGASTIIRVGRVEEGEFVWTEGAQEAMAPLFISPEAKKMDLTTMGEDMPKNAADALASAALDQVRGVVAS